MELFIDLLIVVLVLTNFGLISSSRLSACIRGVAVQGVLFGVLPLFIGEGNPTLRVMVLAGITVLVKGIVFPKLLLRTLRSAEVRREMEPFVGYTTSILVGLLPLPVPTRSPLMVPLALFTIMIGLFAVVSRRKALTQVLGYLVMENGIYAFGLTFAHNQPLLIELGTLLDVFTAIFVMGIAIFHINREFDHIDTDLLNTLRD
jgi:hydrogenase-4 component E